MGEPRYRRGRAFASDMAVYTRTISSDNGAEHQRLKRNLIRALQEEVTPLQRKYLLLYYSEGLNMRELSLIHISLPPAASPPGSSAGRYPRRPG